MPYAELADVRLYYEVSGPSDGEPLVLIHGLGAQMIAWYPGLVTTLEQAGFRVIRFDNRDIGLSSSMEHAPDYLMSDMARDVTGLLDHLGLASAHVAGQSMGGMVAQQLAISFPERVRSLTVIYSMPDNTHRINDPAIQEVRERAPAPDREGRILHFIEQERISGLDGLDEDWIRAFAEAVIDRGFRPDGMRRQAAASTRSPARGEALRELRLPAAVIHGRDDPLLSFTGGIAVAQAIPGAELHIFAGMKHQLPPKLWPDFVRIIGRAATRAGARLTAGTEHPERAPATECR